jgi:hypothetical protein
MAMVVITQGTSTGKAFDRGGVVLTSRPYGTD